MRALRRIALAAGLALAPEGSVLAQDAPQAGGVLLLDQERLFSGSRFGQRVLAELDAKTKELQTENRKLEADLEAEEKALTERRASLPPEEFRKLADAFDAKVKGIRAARDAKSTDLTAQREAARKTFIETAVPILGQILRERGASAIIDRSAVVLSFDRIDITDLAIARVDVLLSPGAAGVSPPPRPDSSGGALGTPGAAPDTAPKAPPPATGD
jgi:Skp family chaperone for outer membrane proteins